MRLAPFALLVVVAVPVAASARQDKEPGIKKGDTIVVRGCLDGGVVQATDIARADDDSSSVPSGATFRMTGDRKLVKQLRDKNDGKIVSVTGILKSELTGSGPQGYNVGGGVRIGIGTPTGDRNRPMGDVPRSLPQLELKSFEDGSTSCGK